MKVVHLNPAGHLGGAERSLLDVIAGLRAARPGWAQTLIVGGDGPLTERARAMGAEVKVMPIPDALAALGDAGAGGPAGRQVGRLKFARGAMPALADIPAYTRRLRGELRACAPDLIHTNGFKMHILGVRAGARGVPVLWHLRDYLSSRPVMAHLMRIYAGRCAGAIANSNSVARDVRAVCRGAARVTAIYNAVDLQRFSPSGGRLDLDGMANLTPAPPRTVRVGLVATMARWKGQEIFLRALALLPADIGVRGYIIGGPIYRTGGSQYTLEELRARAAELKLDGRVGFTGFVDDPAAAMRALDIVVHASSEAEPFGRVVAEAMACGRAAIVSDRGGVTEITTDGVDALWHPCGDAEALAHRIAALATDAQLRAQIGARARAAAAQRFSRERLAKEVIAVYRSLSAAARD